MKKNLCIAPTKTSLIEKIRKLLLFSKDGAIGHSYANHVARIIDQHFAEKSRQPTIR